MRGRFSHRAQHFLENLSVLGAVVMFVSIFSVLPARSQGIPVDSTLSISGSFEVYVAHDFSGSGINNGPGFLYNYTRLNEFAVNLAFLKARFASENVRANFALMTGTYAQANLAAEPPLYQNLFEANAGVLLFPGRNIWLDAGVLPSHIGFESAIGKDNWTLTRSLLAENSPYYEAGAKLSYASSDNVWSISVLALNGWQQLQRPADWTALSWGTQVTYQPGDGLVLNSSTFIGNVGPDSSARMRFFHNLYAIMPVTSTISVIAGFDAGFSERVPGTTGHDTWWSPVLIVRTILSGNLSAAARVEYFHDKAGVIVASGTPNGFQVLGASVNVDYAASSHALCRIEGRLLQSNDPLFPSSQGVTDVSVSIVAALSVYF